MARSFAVLLVGALGACRRDAAPQPEDLTAYLATVEDAAEVVTWKLDEPAWRRIVVARYRDLWPDYARAFDAAAPELAKLVGHAPFADRAHFAGDPALTMDQSVARWALPTLFPSRVATAAGAPIDAVFLRDGGRWRAIVGLGAIVRERLVAIDGPCAQLFAGRPGDLAKTCRDTTWAIADALFQHDEPRTRRACSLATTVCGKRSP